MANNVDPDQTGSTLFAPLGAVWSGASLFAQAYLSENLWSLWYKVHLYFIKCEAKVTSFTRNFQMNFEQEICTNREYVHE